MCTFQEKKQKKKGKRRRGTSEIVIRKGIQNEIIRKLNRKKLNYSVGQEGEEEEEKEIFGTIGEWMKEVRETEWTVEQDQDQEKGGEKTVEGG